MPLKTESANRKDIRTGIADMQRRHFATVAAIIRGGFEDHARDDVARIFADNLAKTNPRFDRARFLRACGA
jgi:hypothetical protein